MINVTKTFLPPIQDYLDYLDRIWDSKWLSNRGELVIELETVLKKKINAKFFTLTTNGTLPLQIAVRQLTKPKSEIITTPFSYVATTSSIVWEGRQPVFVDIHPKFLTIDESKIETAITDNTTAILVTHVYGNPCNVEVIESIAHKHDLLVIYDAAHCFGVTHKGKSIFNYGDISTCSFHATKIFHTGEGGCWVTNDKVIQDKMYFGHNFGHNGPGIFYDVGINAKMSELQAAMGLTVLPYFDDILKKRKLIYNSYMDKLVPKYLSSIEIREDTNWNYCYVPVIFKNEEQLLNANRKLEENQIYSRRYFYPSLNTLQYVNSINMKVSESISKRILCLPTFHDLTERDISKICNLIISAL